MLVYLIDSFTQFVKALYLILIGSDFLLKREREREREKERKRKREKERQKKREIKKRVRKKKER